MSLITSPSLNNNTKGLLYSYHTSRLQLFLRSLRCAFFISLCPLYHNMLLVVLVPSLPRETLFCTPCPWDNFNCADELLAKCQRLFATNTNKKQHEVRAQVGTTLWQCSSMHVADLKSFCTSSPILKSLSSSTAQILRSSRHHYSGN